MHLTKLLPLPQRPRVWKKPKNPNLSSCSSSTPSSNHMNPIGSNLLMPAGKLMKSSSVPKTSQTSSVMPSVIDTLLVLKTLPPDVSLRLGKAIERKLARGKPLLERLGMRQLSLLECLGVPVKKGEVSQICDEPGMMMMTQLEQSQSGCGTTMMSMTRTTLGTGGHRGEDLPGGARQMSAPYGKPKCSRQFTTSIPRMPSAVLMPKETAHHSLTPSGVTSFVTATLTSEPSLRTSSLSKPSMMTPSSSERERNSQSTVVPQGKGDRSAPKVTGSRH